MDDSDVQMTPRLIDLARFGTVTVPFAATAYLLYHELAIDGTRAVSVRTLAAIGAVLVLVGFLVVMNRFVRRDPSYRMASFHYNVTVYLSANAVLAVYVAFGDPVWQNLAGQVTVWGAWLGLHYVGYRHAVAGEMSREELFS